MESNNVVTKDIVLILAIDFTYLAYGKQNVYIISAHKSKGKKLCVRPRSRSERNIKMLLRKQVVGWIRLPQHWIQDFCEYDNETLSFIKSEISLCHLRFPQQ